MAKPKQRGNFMDAPEDGWLHDDRALKVGQGVFYSYPVQYIGNIELAQSLRGLTLSEQTALTRELIGQVVETCGVRNKKSRTTLSSKLQAFLSGKITKAMVDVNLGIAAEGVVIAPVDAGEDGTGQAQQDSIIAYHTMQWISLAAGGELEDYDMLAYVAKDTRGNRACFVFDCGLLSDDVLATMGQAFNLAQGRQAAAGKHIRPALKKRRPPPAPHHMKTGAYRQLPPSQKEEYLNLGPKGRDAYMDLTPDERDAYMDLEFVKDKAVYLQLDKQKRAQYLQVEPSRKATYLETEASDGAYLNIDLLEKRKAKRVSEPDDYLCLRELMQDDYLGVGGDDEDNYLSLTPATAYDTAPGDLRARGKVAYDTPEDGTVELYGHLDFDHGASYLSVEQLARACVDEDEEVYLNLKDEELDDMYLALDVGAPMPEKAYTQHDPKRLVGALNKQRVLVEATRDISEPLRVQKGARGKKPKWRVFNPSTKTVSLDELQKEFARQSVR